MSGIISKTSSSIWKHLLASNFDINGSRNLEPDPEKMITDAEEIRRLDEQTRVKK